VRPWKVKRVVQRQDTNQWHVEIEYPIAQVDNFFAHILKLILFNYDAIHGDNRVILGRDLKEIVVLRP
jgi:hypothetical protein